MPGLENPLLRQCQLYPNLFTYLVQFHSTALYPKGKSLQGGTGVAKNNSKVHPEE